MPLKDINIFDNYKDLSCYFAFRWYESFCSCECEKKVPKNTEGDTTRSWQPMIC